MRTVPIDDVDGLVTLLSLCVYVCVCEYVLLKYCQIKANKENYANQLRLRELGRLSASSCHCKLKRISLSCQNICTKFSQFNSFSNLCRVYKFYFQFRLI